MAFKIPANPLHQDDAKILRERVQRSIDEAPDRAIDVKTNDISESAINEIKSELERQKCWVLETQGHLHVEF